MSHVVLLLPWECHSLPVLTLLWSGHCCWALFYLNTALEWTRKHIAEISSTVCEGKHLLPNLLHILNYTQWIFKHNFGQGHLSSPYVIIMPSCVLVQLCLTLCDSREGWKWNFPGKNAFSRQEYLSGLPFPPPGDHPDPGIEPASPVSTALASRLFTLSHLRNPYIIIKIHRGTCLVVQCLRISLAIQRTLVWSLVGN